VNRLKFHEIWSSQKDCVSPTAITKQRKLHEITKKIYLADSSLERQTETVTSNVEHRSLLCNKNSQSGRPKRYAEATKNGPTAVETNKKQVGRSANRSVRGGGEKKLTK